MAQVTYSYDFRVLSAELRIINDLRRIINCVVKLDKNNSGGHPPKIFVFSFGQDYTPRNPPISNFGWEVWYMHGLLKAAMTENQFINVELGSDISFYYNQTHEDVYGAYSLHPMPLGGLISITIKNKDDPTNFYKFSWEKI